MLNFSNVDDVKKTQAIGDFEYLSSAFFLPSEDRWAVLFNFKKFYEDNSYVSSLWDIIKQNMKLTFSIYVKGIPKEHGIFEETILDDLYIAKFQRYIEKSEIRIQCKDFDTFLARYVFSWIKKNPDDRESFLKFYDAFSSYVFQEEKASLSIAEFVYHLKRFYEERTAYLEKDFLLTKFDIFLTKSSEMDQCQLYAFEKISSFTVSEKNISSLWIFDAFSISGDDREKVRDDFASLQRADNCLISLDSEKIVEDFSIKTNIQMPEIVLTQNKKFHYFLSDDNGFHLPNSFFSMYNKDNSKRDSFISSDDNGFYVVNV